jgi:hypothetical protein
VRATAKVREALAEHRRTGLPFGAAWTAALAALPAAERDEWFEALQDTAGSWKAAYQHRPATRAELALLAAGDPEREPTDEPDAWERICAMCQGVMPATKQRNARYCSYGCQRAAHGRRVAA